MVLRQRLLDRERGGGRDRISHCEAPAGSAEANASTYGTMISTIAAVTAPAPRRNTAPSASARTAASATSAPVPRITLKSVSALTG